MSQFDFPRIYFSGRAFINPATANNNLLLPLLTYDPIQVKTVLPPRIYLSSDLLLLHKLGGLPIPVHQPIHTDAHQHQYIDIEPINTKEDFQEWARTPLGCCPIDEPYHQLYPLVKTKRTQQPLIGQIPASWNFYGGMEFGFQDVSVQNIVIADAETHQIRHITPQTADIAPDLAPCLGASLDLNLENGSNAAVMIDVIPSLALFSQVFCDSMRLKKGERVLMQGKPKKASLRFLNQDRILNQEGAQAASGTFFTVMPTVDLQEGEASPIISMFQQYGQHPHAIKGVFIRYNLFEIQENEKPDYQTMGQKANPAYATVVGSLSPWYENELLSIGVGRQLVSEQPFLTDKKLGSCMCRIDTRRSLITLDLLGSIPESRLKTNSSPAYETYPVGTLSLRLSTIDGAALEIGTLQIGPDQYNRTQLIQTSGLVDFPISDSSELTQEALETGTLALYGLTPKSSAAIDQEVLLLKESEFLVTSDQAGLYADQGQSPFEGYRSFSAHKEPCLIRVFRRGQPFVGQLPMLVMALTIEEAGASATISAFLQTTDFADKFTLHFPTDRAVNVLYAFYPNQLTATSLELVQTMVKTGYFVNLRVLPQHNFNKYLTIDHPEDPTALTFEELYKEVLQVYDFTFPMSSIITPFTEINFKKGGRFIKKRMHPTNWDSASYMPSSRDLSIDQWNLFCKWIDQFAHQ